MGKGSYIKRAERACATKTRFETAQEAERTADYRYRAYACPICHQFHLTSRSGAAVRDYDEPKAQPTKHEPTAKLGDLDWSAVTDPKPKPKRERLPKLPHRPHPHCIPPPPPAEDIAECRTPVGKDGRVMLVLHGKLVKSAKVRDPRIASQLAPGVRVAILADSTPPTILRSL